MLLTPRLPNFVIAGAMRSGTTSLARALGAHPEVFIAPQKEVHYFDLHQQRGDTWYASQFAGVRDEHAVGEATPYMYDLAARRRMAKALPDARLVIILRDPIARAYSHYWMNRAKGIEPLSFEQALAAEPARLGSMDEVAARRYAYVRFGLYGEQLMDLGRFYAREQLLVVLLDDYSVRPRDVYRQVCRFLSIDAGFAPTNLTANLNAYVEFRSPNVRRLARRLPALLRNGIGRVNTRARSYPPMDEKTRMRLEQRFVVPNRELATWLGRDLSSWGPPRTLDESADLAS